MNNIFYTSDTHYGHKNIVRGVSEWKNKKNIDEEGFIRQTRDFSTQKEHDEYIVEMINSTVKEGDIIYHLGDWSFGGRDNILRFRDQLYCRNIHLIRGNHDHHFINPSLDISSKFLSIQDTLTIYDGKNPFIFLSHYKHFVWNKSHKGCIHLYGHSHSSAEHHIIGKSMDVGIDNAKKLIGDYKPFHHDEVMYFMNKRKIHNIDHHDKNTW